MSILMKDHVKVPNKLLKKTVRKFKQYEPNEKLEFTITVFKRAPYQGLDRYFSNAIRVRCKNPGRKKGQPRELEFYHCVWCLKAYVVSKIAGWRTINVPDTKIINKLIEKYSKYGTVTIKRNDINITKYEGDMVIVDRRGNHLDFQYNIIETFKTHDEALQASKKYKTDSV